MGNEQSHSGRVRMGMLWMLASSLVAKGGSFIAQIVLGWILLEEEFGLYAIALSVTSFIQVLKDGGTRKVLIQRGERGFDRLCADVYWIAMISNTAAAAILAALAVPAGMLYDEPMLVPMLLVMSLGTLLGTPDAMHTAALNARMEYRKLSKHQAASALIRHASTILLAVLGLGAMSLAWPWVIRSLAGWVIGRAMTGALPVWRRPRLRVWPKLVCTTLWMTAGTGALTAIRLGPYAVIGLFAPRSVLGVYYFAFQLLLQINVVVAINLQSVLLPSLSAFKNDTARHGRAVVRACAPLVLMGSLAGMAFGVGGEDVVRFVWGERWLSAAPVVQVMALVFPFRMLQSVLDPALMSRGMYRAWALIAGSQALVILAGSVVAGVYFSEPWEFAAVVGVSFVVSIALAGLLMARAISLSFGSLVRPVVSGWVCVAAVYVGVLALRESLGVGGAAPRLELAARGLVSGVVFGVSSLMVLRLVVPGMLAETLGLMPGGVGRPVGRLLRVTPRGGVSAPAAEVEPRE